MSFQLTIAEGKEAGREFVFEQESVSIGRSPECDVVLYDPGVSRRHACLRVEAGAVFVEDTGSSNGTKVNGEKVLHKRQLADGDRITLGPVVFTFAAQEAPAEATQIAALPTALVDQSTRIVDMAQAQAQAQARRQRNKGSALAPSDAEAGALENLGRSSTVAMPAVARSRSRPETRALARPEARPLARPPPEAPLERPAGRRPPLTAAEKARIRRESGGLMASLKLFWLEASPAARLAVYAGAALLGVGLVALVWWGVLGEGGGSLRRAPEPGELTVEPLAASFGLGEGVDFVAEDQKVFGFRYVAATRAVVLLHYQARDIAAGEVSVSVNGTEVGQLPPDGLAATEVAHELVIPPAVLKKGEANQVIFDNLRNPPGEDPWRIWNVWVEVAPLPEQPPAELLREARADYDRAMQAFERRDIGARNRYDAWRGFRSAWLRLEAHPDPKPELYDIAQLKVREAQQELDSVCAKLLLEVQKLYNQKDLPGALATLEHAKEYFPGRDQPCGLRVEHRRAELDL